MTTKSFIFGLSAFLLFSVSLLFLSFAIFCLFAVLSKKAVWIYIYKLSFGHSQVLNQLQWLHILVQFCSFYAIYSSCKKEEDSNISKDILSIIQEKLSG